MKLNIAYFAGVADSDGSFTLSKQTGSTARGYWFRPCFQLTWKLSDKTKEFINMIKQQYGGSICYSTSRSTLFKNKETKIIKYACDGLRLDKLIEDLLPYLILKKEQAEVLLNFRKRMPIKRWGFGNRKPEEVWNLEITDYEKMKTINTKNKKSIYK